MSSQQTGCGLGTESINFVRHGARLTIVELSLKSLDLTRQRFKAYGLEDKVTFYHANAEDLSGVLPEEEQSSFDLVWSFGVIHHTPYPRKIVEEAYKFLKPGAQLRLTSA